LSPFEARDALVLFTSVNHQTIGIHSTLSDIKSC
jgi:hypothetical protein